jgi:hypothetical protein
MNNFKKLIKEALKPNFLNESMASSKELENHPDFDTLITALEDSLGIEMERTLRTGNYNGREGYYLRTPDVGTWTENANETITRALDKANTKAQDYTFEYESVSDFEEDPGERTWDAAIEFFADKKEDDDEMWTDPAGGTHYGDDDDPASSYMEESIDREFHSTKVTSGHPKWSEMSAEEIQDYIDANPTTLWGRSLSTAKMVRDQKQESVNEEEQQHLKMPFANNLPQGPKRIEWYGKHLVKMMTPYDKEGPEGLLNALLDNPEDFPENWRVAPEGEVDYIESVFDEIVAFANDYNELTESVNEMDDNDPVLMMMRANRTSKDTDSTSGIDYDEALSLRIMKRELEKEIDQLYMDMEQEAEPEGGPIADRYGDEIGSLEDRIYSISKQLRDYDMNEELETPNELADESKQDTSASGAYESKEFDFKKMIKESLKPNYLK